MPLNLNTRGLDAGQSGDSQPEMLPNAVAYFKAIGKNLNLPVDSVDNLAPVARQTSIALKFCLEKGGIENVEEAILASIELSRQSITAPAPTKEAPQRPQNLVAASSALLELLQRPSGTGDARMHAWG